MGIPSEGLGRKLKLITSFILFLPLFVPDVGIKIYLWLQRLFLFFLLLKTCQWIPYCFRNYKEFISLLTQYKIQNSSHRKLLQQLLLKTNWPLHRHKIQGNSYSSERAEKWNWKSARKPFYFTQELPYKPHFPAHLFTFQPVCWGLYLLPVCTVLGLLAYPDFEVILT